MRRLTHEDQKKGAIARARRVPIRTASPTMRAVFEKMLEQGWMVKDMAEVMKHHPNIISLWRSGGTEPSIMSVEEMANALGYRLELVPLSKTEE